VKTKYAEDQFVNVMNSTIKMAVKFAEELSDTR
jgi:hypothetical protein